MRERKFSRSDRRKDGSPVQTFTVPRRCACLPLRPEFHPFMLERARQRLVPQFSGHVAVLAAVSPLSDVQTLVHEIVGVQLTFPGISCHLARKSYFKYHLLLILINRVSLENSGCKWTWELKSGSTCLRLSQKL